MANYKYNMDLKRIRQIYRKKFVILCQPGDTQTPDKYNKYQIIDVINQPMEKNLVFLLKDDKNVFRKIVLNREILKTGKANIQIDNHIFKCRIVNARNFPIVDSAYDSSFNLID